MTNYKINKNENMKDIIPYMQKNEYEFINKYLTRDDILLEWGSGTGTIYFSERVANIISVEHNTPWYNKVKALISENNIENIQLHLVPRRGGSCIVEQFKNYMEYPVVNKFKFTKVLIDGRMRRRCAISILPLLDKDCIVFIHDFKRKYYHDVLNYYDVIEWMREGNQIVALKKK